MKYLSRDTQANVSILLAVTRWLAATGPLEYGELEAGVRPRTLTREADNALRATLAVGEHIGLLEQDDSEVWSIATSEGLVDATRRHDRFRSFVRRSMLERAVRDLDDQAGPSDVAIGLTWLCSLDPTRPLAWGWDDGPEATLRSIGMDQVINGNTQWRAFRRWATSLGFAIESRPEKNRHHRLIPDPTVALADCLSEITLSMSAREFVEFLASMLPAIDSGALEPAARQAGVRYDARGEATLGPAAGYALERLQRRGALELRKSDDAQNRVSYRVGGQSRTFDVVTIGSGR